MTKTQPRKTVFAHSVDRMGTVGQNPRLYPDQNFPVLTLAQKTSFDIVSPINKKEGGKNPHNSSLLSCCIFLAVRYFAWRSIPGTLGGGLQMQRLLHRILFCQSWNSAGITPGGVFAKLRKFERSINADGVKRKQTWMLVPIVASS